MKSKKFNIKRIILSSIEYKIDKDNIYCNGIFTFRMVWGSQTIPLDLNIEKVDGWYVIPLQRLKDRKEKLEEIRNRAVLSLRHVNAILNECDANEK